MSRAFPFTLAQYAALAAAYMLAGERDSEVDRTLRAIEGLLQRIERETWNAAVNRVADRVSKTTFAVPIGMHGAQKFQGTDLDAAAFVRVLLQPPSEPVPRCGVCRRLDCLGFDGGACTNRGRGPCAIPPRPPGNG